VPSICDAVSSCHTFWFLACLSCPSPYVRSGTWESSISLLQVIGTEAPVFHRQGRHQPKPGCGHHRGFLLLPSVLIIPKPSPFASAHRVSSHVASSLLCFFPSPSPFSDDRCPCAMVSLLLRVYERTHRCLASPALAPCAHASVILGTPRGSFRTRCFPDRSYPPACVEFLPLFVMHHEATVSLLLV
jgi:hypothetical protein